MVQVADRITVDPEQCGGRPCLRGMRIRVTDILDMLAAGASREEILADYPDLVAEAAVLHRRHRRHGQRRGLAGEAGA